MIGIYYPRPLLKMNGLSICVASKLYAWSQCDRVRGLGGRESGTKYGTFLNPISVLHQKDSSQVWQCTTHLGGGGRGPGLLDHAQLHKTSRSSQGTQALEPSRSLSFKKKNGSLEYRRGPAVLIPYLETSSLPNGELSVPCLPPVL